MNEKEPAMQGYGRNAFQVKITESMRSAGMRHTWSIGGNGQQASA